MTQKYNTSVSHVTWLLTDRGGGIPSAMLPLAIAQSAVTAKVRVFGVHDPARPRVRVPAIPVSALPALGPLRLGFSPWLSRELQGSGSDIVHLHGLFTWSSRAVQVWGRRSHRPVVIAPHGMLDGWALRNSRLKKLLFSALIERRNIRDAACLHVLCESEAASARACGYRGPLALIPNGVDVEACAATRDTSEFVRMHPRAEGRRLLLFMARLHPKKNLCALIDAWAIL
jgi:glycosyltransferase involved in cell wall biosynthesis